MVPVFPFVGEIARVADVTLNVAVAESVESDTVTVPDPEPVVIVSVATWVVALTD